MNKVECFNKCWHSAFYKFMSSGQVIISKIKMK